MKTRKQFRFIGTKGKAEGFVLAFDGSGVVETLRTRNSDRQLEGKMPVGNVSGREANKEVRANG